MRSVRVPEGVLAPPTRDRLHSAANAGDARILSHAMRSRAVDLYLTNGSGRTRPNRRWKIDLDALAFDPSGNDAEHGVSVTGSLGRAIALPLATAAREHSETLARVTRLVDIERWKFGALAMGLSSFGALVHVPADYDVAEPIVITYRIGASSAFPRTLVLLEAGARATVIVEFQSAAGSFVAGTSELIVEERAHLHFATAQQVGSDSIALESGVSRVGRDGSIVLASADFGAGLILRDRETSLDAPGARLEQSALFLPTGAGHLDVAATVRHVSGHTASQTVVKAAAGDNAIARFLGNIVILPHAAGSDASLRDDALVLSPHAHIDSVPALEIACNDVKAYHGATIGAIDDEQIFYLRSRGLDESEARRTIALGFFEPTVDAFPTAALRESLTQRIVETLR